MSVKVVSPRQTRVITGLTDARVRASRVDASSGSYLRYGSSYVSLPRMVGAPGVDQGPEGVERL